MTDPLRSIATWILATTVAATAATATATDTRADSTDPDSSTENPRTPALSRDPHPWSLTLRYENDIFGGTDRFYTDGVSVSLLQAEARWVDGFANCLPWGMGTGRRSVGYDFGQMMITPGDKSLVIPDPRDRPYAGILFAGITLHIENANRYHGLKFFTGVVGPWSLAGETQREIHRWVNSEQSLGWDSQIHNEPIVNFVYEHRRRYTLLGQPRSWSAEALPTATAMLGNVFTQAQIGGQLRWGYNLPDNFGSTLLRGMGHLPSPRPDPDPNSRSPTFGIFLHGGVHGSLVLHNITLDGNTWKDSPSVEKNYLVPSAQVGGGISAARVLLDFSYIFRGREFERQDGSTEFGAFTVTYRF
jgi:lipid A 3-O-deacylase